MAKFSLDDGEQLVRSGTVGYLKGRLQLVPGEGHLTDRRFVHTSAMQVLAVGGLLGALSSGKVDLEVPLGSIARLSRDRHGRNGSILVVGTVDGHDHRLLAAFDEWFAAFSSALSTYRGVGVAERAPGIWHVV